MDEAMGKLGIYEFFSVLISGLIFSTTCLLTGVPERYMLYTERGDTVAVITFLLWSGFAGLVLVGIGSICEKHCPWLMLKNNARKNIFTGKVFENIVELEKVEKIGRSILAKDEEYVLNDNDSRYVHDYCAAYLQAHGKDAKVEQIGAMAGMYRSLMVAFPLQMLLHLFLLVYDVCLEYYRSYSTDYEFTTVTFAIKMIIFALLMIFFGFRAQQMAQYRIRTVLRHYKVLTDNAINRTPDAEPSTKRSA